MHVCTLLAVNIFFISAIDYSMVSDMVLVCCYNHIHVHLTTLMFNRER